MFSNPNQVVPYYLYLSTCNKNLYQKKDTTILHISVPNVYGIQGKQIKETPNLMEHYRWGTQVQINAKLNIIILEKYILYNY